MCSNRAMLHALPRRPPAAAAWSGVRCCASAADLSTPPLISTAGGDQCVSVRDSFFASLTPLHGDVGCVKFTAYMAMWLCEVHSKRDSWSRPGGLTFNTFLLASSCRQRNRGAPSAIPQVAVRSRQHQHLQHGRDWVCVAGQTELGSECSSARGAWQEGTAGSGRTGSAAAPPAAMRRPHPRHYHVASHLHAGLLAALRCSVDGRLRNAIAAHHQHIQLPLWVLQLLNGRLHPAQVTTLGGIVQGFQGAAGAGRARVAGVDRCTPLLLPPAPRRRRRRSKTCRAGMHR